LARTEPAKSEAIEVKGPAARPDGALTGDAGKALDAARFAPFSCPQSVSR
jgi:hypothetical protein